MRFVFPGSLLVNINGLLFMYIVESSEISYQAATFTLDIVANIQLHVAVSSPEIGKISGWHCLIPSYFAYFKNNTLLGKTTVDSLQLKNNYGYINISDDELSDLALLSSEMLQRFSNDFLRGGFPIPIPKGFFLFWWSQLWDNNINKWGLQNSLNPFHSPLPHCASLKLPISSNKAH